jgi:signal transduction histidine kinase
MFPKSIRWRLPLSYAGIAFLVALMVGIVLLVPLRNYYLQQETAYLHGNADAISGLLGRILSDNPYPPVVLGRFRGFSFLSQTRIQFLNTNREVVADSGVPEGNDLVSIRFNRKLPADAASGAGQLSYTSEPAPNWVWSMSSFAPTTEEHPTYLPWKAGIQIFNCETSSETDPQSALAMPSCVVSADRVLPVPTDAPDERPKDQMLLFSVAPSLYGFGLSDEVRLQNNRSDQSVEVPVIGRENQFFGYVRLSDGPAYGREIVDAVAQGWLIASIIAVAFAGGTGWVVSRRITAPLVRLTQTTTYMAQGNLSARVDIAQEDELGTLAQAFNDMAHKIEETVIVLRRFVADAAHEIHTPLTALRTNLELALGEQVSPEYVTYLNRAQAQVNRLETLTDGLLQLSRVESGTANDLREPLDVVQLVREMSEFYASCAEQAGLTFELQLPNCPVMMTIPAAQFRSMLSNLIDNAIKFTLEGGTVRLGMRPRDGHLEVWVQDTGIGIPAEDLPLVFNRFHRARNVSGYNGSGLGLALVKAVVERLRGNVAVESGTSGTRFLLQLPIGSV